MAKPGVAGNLLIQTGFDSYVRKPAAARHVLKSIETILKKVSKDLLGGSSFLPTGSTCGSSTVDTSSLAPATPHHVAADRVTSDNATPGQATLDHATPAGHATVAYVDDSPIDSQAMGDIVQRAGYSYVNVSDSFQVLSQLVALRPKLIFLSLVLPVANSYELCAQIRRISDFQDTPIIIVAEDHKIAERVRAKMAGASAFLSKPIRAKSVLRTLIRYLSPVSTV